MKNKWDYTKTPKQSLSDKVFDTFGVGGGKLFVKDVKQSVKKLKGRMKEGTFVDVIKEIDKIFGEKLTGENWKEKFVGVKDENT